MSLSTLGMRLCCASSCLLLISTLHSATGAPMPGIAFNPGSQGLIRDRPIRLEELQDLPGKSAMQPFKLWEESLLLSSSIEFLARGKHLAASVTFAHSLERPEALSEREAPIYFRLDLFL